LRNYYYQLLGSLGQQTGYKQVKFKIKYKIFRWIPPTLVYALTCLIGRCNIHFIVFFNQKKNIQADIIVNMREKVGYIEQIIFNDEIDEQSRDSIIKSTNNILSKLDIAIIQFLCFECNHLNIAESKILLSLGFYQIKKEIELFGKP